MLISITAARQRTGVSLNSIWKKTLKAVRSSANVKEIVYLSIEKQDGHPEEKMKEYVKLILPNAGETA